MNAAFPSRSTLQAPREGVVTWNYFFKIYKLPTQGRQDFKTLNLWYGSDHKSKITNPKSKITNLTPPPLASHPSQ